MTGAKLSQVVLFGAVVKKGFYGGLIHLPLSILRGPGRVEEKVLAPIRQERLFSLDWSQGGRQPSP